MINHDYYAHSLPNENLKKWHKLCDHLYNVTKLASCFSGKINAEKFGYSAGLLHDLGKYSLDFQNKLLTASQNQHVDHSSAGAQYISKFLDNDFGYLIAYTIAGHHGGLPDGKSNDSCLHNRLQKSIPKIPNEIIQIVREKLPVITSYKLPLKFIDKNDLYSIAFSIQFFVRFIFSTLVDADYLDTESFYDHHKIELRKNFSDLNHLKKLLNEKLNSFPQTSAIYSVNYYRKEVLNKCIKMAEEQPGLFSLTVPTGGGKTLSSMAFAINHALKHGMERIIYVIPYTSIIEQTAQIFKDIFGNDVVLEHHSNFDFESDTAYSERLKLASENWDIPIVVTTNVQFFETIFHHKPSRCRKIHNISRSVIIFDEAQLLPISLLRPCMAVIKELVTNYRTSIVLCSATQPALAKKDDFKHGFDKKSIREILIDPQNLYIALKRIKINQSGHLSDTDLAEKIVSYPQVLCVVNTRKHARTIFQNIDDKNNLYHLSALMCPVHRSKVISEIKMALENKQPCRVISTQLIEAGVDIDFPVVFRATAGIDSIAQSAGRCNREGKLTQKGMVFVFEPESGIPPGHLRHCAEIGKEILRNFDDCLSLEAIESYFKNLYWRAQQSETGLDENQILKLFKEGLADMNFPFKTIGEMFHIIDQKTRPLIIPYNDEARKIIDQLRYSQSYRSILRKAQRFTVQIYPDMFNKLKNAGVVELLHDQFAVLVNDDIYKPDIGLDSDDPTFRKIENTIC